MPSKVTCPLLFLTGSEDRINPPATVARIAALYGDRATAEVLDGMGHWLIGEPGWEKLASARWLADRTSGCEARHPRKRARKRVA